MINLPHSIIFKCIHQKPSEIKIVEESMLIDEWV